MFSGVAAATINTIVMIIAYPVYLYFLGYEKYGIWLVLTTILTFAQLGNLGISPTIMKLVSEEYGKKNIDSVQKYVTTALILLCVTGTIALIIILIFKNQIISLFKLNDENAKTALWLLPYVAFLSIYIFIVQALNAVLSGLGRMDLSNYIQSFGRIITVVIAAPLLFLGYGIESMLISSVLSYVFIHILSFICIRRIINLRLLNFKNMDFKCIKRILFFGSAILGGSLISMFLSPFNKLMLSRYVGVSTIPIYEIAFNGSMQVRALVESSFRALMPEISRIGANMNEYAFGRIKSIYNRAVKFVFILGVPLYTFLIIAAPLLLMIWLGDRFVPSLPSSFRIMLLGTFLSLLGVPAYYTIMGIGRVHLNLGAHIVQALINILIIFGVLTVSAVTIHAVVWSSAIAMGGATLYLFWQKKHTLHRVINDSSKSVNKENIEPVYV